MIRTAGIALLDPRSNHIFAKFCASYYYSYRYLSIFCLFHISYTSQSYQGHGTFHRVVEQQIWLLSGTLNSPTLHKIQDFWALIMILWHQDHILFHQLKYWKYWTNPQLSHPWAVNQWPASNVEGSTTPATWYGLQFFFRFWNCVRI